MNWAKPFLKRGHKYKAVRAEYAGRSYPSKLEAAVRAQLDLLEKAGEIENIREQVTIHLIGNLKLKIDFVVFDKKRNCDVGHEAKGKPDLRFQAIKQAWPGCAPLDMAIWSGSYKRPFISEIVRGKDE